jgi:hypothetical protein
MRVIASERARDYVRAHGGRLWVWLDPHRSLVGAYTQLDAATEPPGTSRRTRVTRASRRPHRFRRVDGGGFELLIDFGRRDLPEKLDLELKGWTNKRIEAFWNGCVFVDDDVTLPGASG